MKNDYKKDYPYPINVYMCALTRFKSTIPNPLTIRDDNIAAIQMIIDTSAPKKVIYVKKYFIEFKTHKEIADEMDVTSSTIQTGIKEILQTLYNQQVMVEMGLLKWREFELNKSFPDLYGSGCKTYLELADFILKTGDNWNVVLHISAASKQQITRKLTMLGLLEKNPDDIDIKLEKLLIKPFLKSYEIDLYWRIYDKKSGIYQIFQDPETKEWIGGFEKNEDWQSKEIENKLVKQIPNIIKNIK